jgi:hypothetical protein
MPKKDDKKRQKTKPNGLVFFVLHIKFRVVIGWRSPATSASAMSAISVCRDLLKVACP